MDDLQVVIAPARHRQRGVNEEATTVQTLGSAQSAELPKTR